MITASFVATLLLTGQVAIADAGNPARPAPLTRDSASIRGRVTDVRTGDPVVAATVELIGPGGNASAISDHHGEYVLEGVAAGVHRVRVQHPGYAPSTLSLTVGDGARLMLDLPLDLVPIRLEPIVVRTTSNEAARAADEMTRVAITGHGPATPYLLSSAPPAMSLAGASRADDPDTGGPGDVFLVRGFTADLKRTMLDDAPIHTAFHMGGLMDPLPAGLVQAITVQSGGAPARYDGGLTWVMDVRTRDPAPGELSGRFAVDWLTAQGHIEGSLGEAADLLISGRGTLSGAAETLLDRPLGYDYREGLVRTHTDLGDGATLRMTGFVNDESVLLPRREEAANWGSTLMSARIEAPRFATLAAYSEGHVRLPAAEDGAVAVDAYLRQGHLSLEGRLPGSSVSAAYGLDIDAYDFARSGPDGADVRDEAARYTTTGAYGDVSWQVEPRVRLHGGLRLNYFAPERAVHASPRLALNWLIDERAMLTVAAGRFSQYVRVQEGSFRDPFALTPVSYEGVRVADTTALARSEMVVQEATHVTLSLDQQLSDHTRLELDGFVKDYGGIPAAEGSRLQASGLDVWIGSRGESLSGWFGYSLSWVWSRDDVSSAGGADDSFNARQILSAGVTGHSTSLGTLSVNASYGSGLPLTSVELERSALRDGLLFENGDAAEINSLGGAPGDTAGLTPRTDRFLRIDVEASRTWQLGDDERGATLRPYIRLLNALDRRDAIFFHRDAGDGSMQPLATVPLLPLFGLEVRW